MNKPNWWQRAGAFCVLSAMAATAANAQTFATLHSFDGTDGAAPNSLVQGTNGSLYGETRVGGANGLGTAYKITPSGTLTTLYQFCSQSGCRDGQEPAAGLVQATDGNFYGTASFGGANGDGMVFKMSQNGTQATLYSFCPKGGNCAGGKTPYAALIQGTDGNFYGTTSSGGDGAYDGTVFKITAGGTLTTLYSFCSQSGCTDGDFPVAALVQASGGNFYGTTAYGGAGGDGTVFGITPSGTLTTLHSFEGTDGDTPSGALVQATDGSFYGTTYEGGANKYGTVFTMTSSGTLTTLYSFCSQSDCTDGAFPYAGLIQATDGNFYGTTSGGGANSGGTVFKITPGGTLTTLYSFCSQTNCADGDEPFYGPLFQDTNGSFYGATVQGGTGSRCGESGCGTIFSLSVGLDPFVSLLPASGPVGQKIGILGTSLTGVTSVTFNGTAATFTVISPSLVTATVPVGASSGTVEVTTPGGTLKSSVPFHVKP